MAFEVSADSYETFMGHYSGPLAPLFADWSDVAAGQRALDVGCGTGALTRELVKRLGVSSVAAVDPSVSFVAAARGHFPEVEVQLAGAEDLPFEDAEFDVSVAQLVVQFMSDPQSGVREMARVTRPGGLVSACVWDHAGGRGPLAAFWDAVHEVDPDAQDESGFTGTAEGSLHQLFDSVGLRNVQSSTLTVIRHYESFDAWWHPFTLGVGPAGAYLVSRSGVERESLRIRCAERLPSSSFDVSAMAWCARGVVSGPESR
jgi:SAM-dependent methyltransferase